MHKTIEALCVALDTLAERLRSGGQAAKPTSRHGWNCAPVAPDELAVFPAWLAGKLREAAPDDLPDTLTETLSEYPARLESLQGSGAIGNLVNGNAVHSVPVVLSTLETLEKLCLPLFEWKQTDPKLLPPALAKRLSTVRTGIEAVAADASDLAAKVTAINDAHAAAESLPVVLSQLTEARVKTEKASELVGKLQTKAEENVVKLRAAIDEANVLKARAAEVMSECEDTYRSLTATGLAAAFHQRCRKLELGSWFWIGGLIVALGVGAWLGSHRVAALTDLLNAPEPKWGTIWLNVILSVVGLGAPIWFAWMCTKQIGQRFRLAEDYAYKAAVAQAYEGFRREASRHKGDFEQRLLSSALTRLDEAPLRWVEAETHGSPWHELIESPAFQKALESVQGLRAAVAKAGKRRGETKPVPEVPSTDAN